MIEIEKVAENLFDKIRSRFPMIRIGDESAKSTLDPTKARIFNFDFNDNFDNVTISLVDENNLKIYYDMQAPKQLSPDEKKTWEKFLKNIRFFAMRNGLTFDVRDIAQPGLGQADLKHLNKDAEMISKDEIKVTESKLYGTSRSSYQKLENVRIIARHSKPIVDETKPGARSRNIECFYIENSLGERFRLPEGTTLNGARAFARHVKNGGSVMDDFGQHIGKLNKEMASLKMFARNMRGKQFEDAETSAMVESAINYYGKLHSDLFALRGQRGYEQYKSLWQPEVLDEEDFDINALRERFVRKVFDDRLMDALPVVQRAYNKMRNQVGEEFEAWANGVMEEDNDDGESSVFANSIGPEDTDGNVIDGDQEDQDLANLFNEHGFQFRFMDGVYYFESKQEIERAKDIIAAWDPHKEFPRMGVYDYGYGNYGATTMDREIGSYSNGVSESAQDKEMRLFKTLAGIIK